MLRVQGGSTVTSPSNFFDLTLYSTTIKLESRPSNSIKILD